MVLQWLPEVVRAEAYDPLQVTAAVGAQLLDRDVIDESRNRTVPLRVYLPEATTPAAVVLFSHGLGGSREGSGFLGKHWAARGYIVVFLQHPGSDESVWRDLAQAERLQALQKAANPQTFMQRVFDVAAVLDQLAVWNKASGDALSGRIDLDRVGMSGHSFGAVTTQAVSGQATANGRQLFLDKRIDAAIIMSPSTPRRGTAEVAFRNVRLPWLLMTGTRDTAPIGDQDMASRLAVYPSLPTGGKYELVLDGAEHSAFTERRLPGEVNPRNPAHHPAILAISTAFWDAWLKKDAAAREWIDGVAVRGVLAEADRWQRK
ncbi:MAG: dienelactone hydrolase [Gammaproteobacteria bacterium]|nr:dienelactone hydrolase [Gammaproteobacteria bacterium]